MFWWIKPLFLSFAVLALIGVIFLSVLIAMDARSKIIKFFIGTVFVLLSIIYIFLAIFIIYEIWIEYLPV